MKLVEIESWALRVLESIEKHLPFEDSLVELKTEWPNPAKAARRIAGHANAARGENILWLIGVDEKNGIVGANHQELSNWLSAVQSHFNGITPDLQTVNVACNGKNIAALCFDTSRAPFVVKNPAFGKTAGEPVEWEVPWREGTKTRSASRNDLVLLLSPLSALPKIEILAADMRVIAQPTRSIHFSLMTYFIPRSDTPITFPFHKCAAYFDANGSQFAAHGISFGTPSEKQRASLARMQAIHAEHRNRVFTVLPLRNELIEATADEIVIRGAGKVSIEGDFNFPAIAGWPELELKVTLAEAVTETKILLTVNLVKRDTKDGALVWSKKATLR